jgi:hypothetical protein
VLRRIFGSEMDDVTGGWRKLLDEGLHNSQDYNSLNVIRDVK